MKSRCRSKGRRYDKSLKQRFSHRLLRRGRSTANNSRGLALTSSRSLALTLGLAHPPLPLHPESATACWSPLPRASISTGAWVSLNLQTDRNTRDYSSPLRPFRGTLLRSWMRIRISLNPLQCSWPMLLPRNSVNQRLPSGPAVMPTGWLSAVGIGNSRILPESANAVRTEMSRQNNRRIARNAARSVAVSYAHQAFLSGSTSARRE